MTDLSIPVPVIVVMIAGSASIVVVAINSLVSGHRESANRRRDAYSKALTAITQYEEFPYVVRRRKPDGLEDERIRISTEMRAVQKKLSYYSSWLHSESKDVSEAYETLVSNTRAIVGSEIRRAWSEPPVTSDSGMNMLDLGLGALKPVKNHYLDVVAEELSSMPKWLRRLTHKKRDQIRNTELPNTNTGEPSQTL